MTEKEKVFEQYAKQIDEILKSAGPYEIGRFSKSFRFNGKPTKHDIDLIISESDKTFVVEVKATLDSWWAAASAESEPTTALKKANAKKPSEPPRFAEFCVTFLAPKNTAQALLGDMQEMFQKNAARFGEKQARRMYWMDVAASAWPLVWTWIKRIGLFTALAEYVRSKFGL